MFKSLSSRRSSINPVIETLEGRRLLSADLTGVFTNQLPEILQAADRNHAAVRVTNDTGTKFAGPVTVDLFAAAPGTSDGEVLLSSVTRNVNLKSDRASVFNFRFAEPAGLSDGSYSLVAQISSSRVTDPTPSDSIVTAPSPITVQQPYTDVTVKSVNAPTQSIYILNAAERTEPASVTVVNQGTEKATGAVSISFFLSTHSTLDSQAFSAGNVLSGINLKPGASHTFSGQISAPTSTPTGMYYLFAVVKPVSGFVQNNATHEVAFAATQVSVENTQIVPAQAATGTTNQTTDSTGQNSNTTTGSSNGTTDTGCDTGSTCDSGTTDSGCDTGSTDQSTDTGCDNGGTDQTTDDSTDQTTDSGSDNSTDSGSDDSSDSGSDDSSDSSSDDTSDSGSDDSSDSSSDDSSDDSGGDDTEDDSIARRSSTSASQPVQTMKTVLHSAASTPIHAVVYKKAGHPISGGHR